MMELGILCSQGFARPRNPSNTGAELASPSPFLSSGNNKGLDATARIK